MIDPEPEMPDGEVENVSPHRGPDWFLICAFALAAIGGTIAAFLAGHG